MHPVQLYCWHFMPYPYLMDDLEKTRETRWATAPNAVWDRARSMHSPSHNIWNTPDETLAPTVAEDQILSIPNGIRAEVASR